MFLALRTGPAVPASSPPSFLAPGFTTCGDGVSGMGANELAQDRPLQCRKLSRAALPGPCDVDIDIVCDAAVFKDQDGNVFALSTP